MRTLALTESDKYFFDPDAAEKPLRFIRKYCRHYEGQWAGQHLDPLPWQADLIRTLYGWRHRATGLRRFRELYLITGKCAGKTPILSALGMFHLFGEGEPAAHVVSIATDFKQAQLTQEWARRSIEQDPQLSKAADLTQFEIRYGRTKGKWTTLSGTFQGRAGFRPSLILADEAHEWPNGKLYKNITANMAKRREPLLLIATNAGPNRNCFCWQLQEQAQRVLDGTSEREDLLPVICEAAPELDWTTEAAAAAANPSLGAVITFDALRPIIAAAKESAADQAHYCRLYLSRWDQGAENKWLDLARWDAATAPFSRADVKGLPLFLSLDMSLNDDLTALVWIWAGPEKLFVRCHQWIPKATADRYEDKEGLPFSKWAAAGAVTLLDQDTIDHNAQVAIARIIRRQAKKYDLRSLSYDPARANNVIAQVERAGIPCIPVKQRAVDLTAACQELERRLTAKSIAIRPNDLLRTQAGAVELWADSNGLCKPVKESAKGKYAGRRGAKIDGVAALVTGLASVLREGMAEPTTGPLPAVFSVSL